LSDTLVRMRLPPDRAAKMSEVPSSEQPPPLSD
jgi:hypothetical protein